MACLCPLRGPGSMYIIDLAGNGFASFKFGNASDWAINADVEEESQPDYEDQAFAPCASDESISNVTLTGTGYEFCPKNQRLLTAGTSTETAAGAQSEIDLVVYKKQFVELLPLPDPSGSMVVETADGLTTYVEGTDYLRGHSGIYIMDSGSIADAVDSVTPNIQVTYTGLATSTTEAFTAFGTKTYKMILDVLNTGAGGIPERTVMHKVKFGLLTNFPRMGQTFQSFAINARLQADSTITGSTLSKYFKTVSVTPAETV